MDRSTLIRARRTALVAGALLVLAPWTHAVASGAPVAKLIAPSCDATSVQVRFTGDGIEGASAMVDTNGTTTAAVDIPTTGSTIATAQIAPRSRNEVAVRVNGAMVLEQAVGAACVSDTPESEGSGLTTTAGAGQLPFTGAARTLSVSAAALLLIFAGATVRRRHRRDDRRAAC